MVDGTPGALCTGAVAAPSRPARREVGSTPASRGQPNANPRSRLSAAARGPSPAPIRPASPRGGGAVGLAASTTVDTYRLAAAPRTAQSAAPLLLGRVRPTRARLPTP